IRSSEPPGHHIGAQLTSTKEQNTARRVKHCVSEVPEHVQDLYTSTCVSRSEDECSRIAECLIKFKDTFSKDEFDLGLTSLVEHEIDVGNHKPIKQPPRRVPVAFASEEETLSSSSSNRES
ncbi:MAG: hypothetical protein AB2693_11045, partial [Candidatus Thiodiazotropha sp.]